MSFILDALRKSENARQRHGGPALAEVPMGRRREHRPWWVWAVAALLVINLIVLLVVLISSNEPAEAVGPTNIPAPAVLQPAPAAVVPAPTTAVVTTPPVVRQSAANTLAVVPAPSATPVAHGQTLADEAAVEAQPLRDPSAPAAAANVPDRGPIVRQVNPGAPATTGQTGSEENLPTLNELTGDRSVNMPPMHLDIHVYSANPAERFVFINNRKYVEGATLTEGPIVEHIRTDGVVLNQRGFRFVLPRQ